MSEPRSEIGRPRKKSEPETWGWDDAQCDPVIERVSPVTGGQRVHFTLYAPKDKVFEVEFQVELAPGEVDDRDAVTRLGDTVRANLHQLNCPGARVEDNKIVNMRGGSQADVVRFLPFGWIGKQATFMLIATESKCPPSN